MLRGLIILCSALLAGFATPAAGAAAGGGPTTTITAGPQGESTSDTAQFSFTADQPATFECALDGGSFAPCTTPYTASGLSMGSHTFSVRAIDASGNVEASPPSRTWIVVPAITPPDVFLNTPRKLKLRNFTRIAGTATAPSGVKAVQAAIQIGGPNKNLFPPGCHYIDVLTAKQIIQPCVLPLYRAIHGTTNWSWRIPARVRQQLRAGSYTLIVRAFNVYGEATQARFKLVLH